MANTVKAAFVPTTANLAYANKLISQLDGLVSQRKQWEATDYKKANDGLYSLLASCLEVFKSKFVDADDSDKKTLRADLTARLTADGVRVQRNTTTLTMFVRFVFGSDRKRAHGYTYVLKAAISYDISAASLPSWIIEQGGIEEVRKRMIVSEEAQQRKADLAVAQAQVKANLEQAAASPLAKLPMSGVSGQYALLLAKPEPDGMLSIVGAISDINEAFYNACLLKMARVKAADNAQTLALSKESTDLLANSAFHTPAVNDSIVNQQALAA
ncbi:MAG: hypothetical protein B7X60_01405 [Polynucleobacter sp. 39-45-136]|jgi:hypothetical protein|nr:MAG: hypothetical protein B7X60_01405 [Polynucleobacter sp. 39-45-136]